MENREHARAYWDEIWERWADSSRRRGGGCDWLRAFDPLWTSQSAPRLLDLGCGSGREALHLMSQGARVIAAERSWIALESLHGVAPSLPLLRLDLGDGLPLADDCLDGILANLSLHYFRRQHTRRVVADLGRCLRPGGWLLARLNASDDVAHGAEGHPEIEPGCYCVDGRIKRFFDRPGIERLFAPPWRIEYLAHETVEGYGRPKPLWQMVIRWAPRQRPSPVDPAGGV